MPTKQTAFDYCVARQNITRKAANDGSAPLFVVASVVVARYRCRVVVLRSRHSVLLGAVNRKSFLFAEFYKAHDVHGDKSKVHHPHRCRLDKNAVHHKHDRAHNVDNAYGAFVLHKKRHQHQRGGKQPKPFHKTTVIEHVVFNPFQHKKPPCAVQTTQSARSFVTSFLTRKHSIANVVRKCNTFNINSRYK